MRGEGCQDRARPPSSNFVQLFSTKPWLDRPYTYTHLDNNTFLCEGHGGIYSPHCAPGQPLSGCPLTAALYSGHYHGGMPFSSCCIPPTAALYPGLHSCRGSFQQLLCAPSIISSEMPPTATRALMEPLPQVVPFESVAPVPLFSAADPAYYGRHSGYHCECTRGRVVGETGATIDICKETRGHLAWSSSRLVYNHSDY